jgi:hypothetical protein
MLALPLAAACAAAQTATGVNYNATTPAAPAGYQNVHWQYDSSRPTVNASAYVPLQTGLPWCADNGSTAAAYACVTTPSFTPPIGTTVLLSPLYPNTGATTLSVNGSTPAQIYNIDGSDLVNFELGSGGPLAFTMGPGYVWYTQANPRAAALSTCSLFGCSYQGLVLFNSVAGASMIETQLTSPTIPPTVPHTLISTPAVIVTSSGAAYTGNTNVTYAWTDLGPFSCIGDTYIGDVLIQLRLSAATLTPAQNLIQIFAAIFADNGSGAPTTTPLTSVTNGIAENAILGMENASSTYTVTAPATSSSSYNYPELASATPIGIVSLTGHPNWQCPSTATYHLALYVPAFPASPTLQYASATLSGQGFTSADNSTPGTPAAWGATTNIAGSYQLRGADSSQMTLEARMMPVLNVYGVDMGTAQFFAVNNNAIAANCGSEACIHVTSPWAAAYAGLSTYASYVFQASNLYGGAYQGQQTGTLASNASSPHTFLYRAYSGGTYYNTAPLLTISDSTAYPAATNAPTLLQISFGGAVKTTMNPGLATSSGSTAYAFDTSNVSSAAAHDFTIASAGTVHTWFNRTVASVPAIAIAGSQNITSVIGTTDTAFIACATGTYTNGDYLIVDSHGGCTDGGTSPAASGATIHPTPTAGDVATFYSPSVLQDGGLLPHGLIYGSCSGTVTSNGTIVLFGAGQTGSLGCAAVATGNQIPIGAHSVTNMHAWTATASSTTNSGVVTLYKNGVATALTCTLSTATSCEDLTHSVAFADGDRAMIKVQSTASSGETLATPNATAEVY